MTPEENLHRKALALLPHGPEFRFLDRLTRLDPGVEGEGEYRVRGDEPFLRGHFPDAPLFPGVLLVEAAAQLAGLVAQSDPNVPPLRDLKLTALRSVKITGSARPGEVLRIQARVVGRLGNLVQARANVFAGGQTAMSGDLTLSGSVPNADQFGSGELFDAGPTLDETPP